MNELMRRLLVLPEQRSTVAQDIDTLHYFVISITMLGAVAVALVALYFIIRYRRGGGHSENRPPDERSGHALSGIPYWAEFVVIAGLLSLFVTWWVIGYRQYVRLQDAPEDSMEVYVIGKQWMWQFAYPDNTRSNGVLYVPSNQPVKLIMTSRDVIHSFYVPAFRIKQDVLPGRFTAVWFEVTEPGTYDIYCTEYCGAGHSTMRGRVIALAPDDYMRRGEDDDAEQLGYRGSGYEVPAGFQGPGSYEEPATIGQFTRRPVTLVEMGERAAARHGCLRCHTVDGAPHIGPTWARAFGSIITLESGQKIVVDEQYITESIMDPLAKIHGGFPPVMPSYQGLMSAVDIGAIVHYMKSLKDLPLDIPASPLPLDERGLKVQPPVIPGKLPNPIPEPELPAADRTGDRINGRMMNERTDAQPEETR